MVSGPQGPESRRFVLAAVVAAGLGLVAVVLLLPEWPSALRSAATSVGLVVAAGVGAVSAVLRLRRIDGPERRAWALLVVAGLVAILGNVWVVVSDADPVTSPSLLSDASIALALAISTAGLLAFPGPQRRGAELVSMFLDGVVAGGALLVIVSVLVYTELFEAAARGDDLVGTFAVLIPALDIALATVALLLILRASRPQRLTFGLVALGFLLYAVADLTFAVRLARGTFEFGSLLDLGWIVGYLIFGLAAWVPIHRPDHEQEQERGPGLSDALGTVLVFSVLLVAAVVQVGFGESANPQGAQAVAWIVLVLAAGARQVLLSVDNTRLRRGLERRVAEQTQDLRRLARQNALLLESVGDGIYGVDRDGLLTFMNPSASVSLGHPLDRVAGQRAHDVFRAPPAAAGQPDHESDSRPGDDARTRPVVPTSWESSSVARAMREQVVVASDDEVYRRADGSELPVEITAAPVLDDGQVLGAVVVFRDVTQRREVDQMKNEFLSVVSHELRTPLTSIRASLELIGGGHLGEVPSGAGSLITVALESTERLTRLINDLLDIERIESGDRPLQLTSLGVRDLLESAAEQIAGLAAALGIRVEVSREAGFAGATGADLAVLGDEDQLLQTLLNLLGNACKFSEPGSTVTLRAEPEGSWVTLAVLDQGRGIPIDKLESVFDRFGQVDASDTRLQGGTGLGLAICRGIVHRHGGQIWAESELGVGTTVSFTVPRSRRSGSADPPPDSPPAESPPPSYAAPGVGRTGPGAGPHHGPTVLVCDDDVGLVASFSAVLQAHGFRPVALTDGARVAEVLAAERPDLVMLDLLMPGTTGAQALGVLRAEPAFATTPVVIVSGLGPDADPVVAQDAEGWLVKPVGEQRLVDTVNRTLDLDRGSRPRLVLLVEDDEAMATVVSTRLRLAGLSVVRASSASEAVQRGRDLTPDLVVLDLALPDGTGHDVVHDFRRRGTLARTPLIVYSALEVGAVSRDDLRLGETRFLEKSRTSAEDLIRQVLELVGAAIGTAPSRPPSSTTASSTPPSNTPPSNMTQHDGPDGGAARGRDSNR